MGDNLAEGVAEGLQGSCFPVDIAEIVAHKADDPNAVVDLLDADAVSGEGVRQDRPLSLRAGTLL
jgi:hypothetical protein